MSGSSGTAENLGEAYKGEASDYATSLHRKGEAILP